MRPLFATSHPSCYPPTSMILNGKYDFNKLHTVTKTITYNLNCMINIYYPISKAHQSNFHHCPISFRIQGLVDTFMALNYMHCSINLTPIYLVGVLVMLLYQWLLKSTDMGSLYWQHSEMMGLNVTSPDYLNIHTWLDPMAWPHVLNIQGRASWCYSGWAAKDEHFEVCISNHNMNEAVGNMNIICRLQVVLDITFSICDKKILLFILMGIDENQKAYLLHSCCSQCQRAIKNLCRVQHQNYHQASWQCNLGTCNNKVYAAITDTDLMEHKALVIVFPQI